MLPTIEDGIFKNYPGEKKHPIESLLSFFWRACKTYISPRAYTQLPLSYNFQEELASSIAIAIKTNRNTLWWLGHATFLLYVNGAFIITDPILQEPSPIFPRLFSSENLEAMLPPIKTILISHNHYDHLDKKSIKALLQKNPQLSMFVPQGDAKLCSRWGCNHIHESMWWDTFSLHNQDIQITFVPAKHWSRRTLFDCNRSLWGGWVIQTNDLCIYFAGDTAQGDHFSAIHDHFTDITHALLPIGPCEPRKENEDSHINPIQAGEIFNLLQAQCMIPCHWGTFPLGIDQPLAPIDLLQHWITNQHNNKNQSCQILFPGQALELASNAKQPTLPTTQPGVTIKGI